MISKEAQINSLHFHVKKIPVNFVYFKAKAVYQFRDKAENNNMVEA